EFQSGDHPLKLISGKLQLRLKCYVLPPVCAPFLTNFDLNHTTLFRICLRFTLQHNTKKGLGTSSQPSISWYCFIQLTLLRLREQSQLRSAQRPCCPLILGSCR